MFSTYDKLIANIDNNKELKPYLIYLLGSINSTYGDNRTGNLVNSSTLTRIEFEKYYRYMIYNVCDNNRIILRELDLVAFNNHNIHFLNNQITATFANRLIKYLLKIYDEIHN